jgi:hypothetical protein
MPQTRDGAINMGIDALDLCFRLEKHFGIRITAKDFEMLHARPDAWDPTAGEVHAWIVKLCATCNVRVPWSSWNRVRLALANVVRKPPQFIKRDTHLIRDSDFSG